MASAINRWLSVRVSLAVVIGLGLSLAFLGGGVRGAEGRPCNRNHPEGCLYTSDLSYEAGVVDRIELVDEARHDHSVPILVRYPIGAAGPRPVVIWNHGGAVSANGKNRSAEWGTLLASAGYVVIHPSRVLPDDATPFVAECTANGFYPDEESCRTWIAQMRYGPMNTGFIMQSFDDIEAADPALVGLLDDDTVAVAGHSAGSTTVHVNAGAWQQWTTVRYEEPLEGPVAFLATGPQGPMHAQFGTGFQSKEADAGWEEHSWAGIDRPYMFITGVGDETGEPPESRTTGFLTSQPGDKYLVWDTAPQAVHETMDIDKCDSPIQADHCSWIGSAGLAFVDAYVRGRNAAQRWLASDSLSILSEGTLELHRR